MNNEIEVIRGSEQSDFLRCRKRWNYRWNEGLRPKKLNDKLFIGSLIHKWLEVYYKTGDEVQAVRQMESMWLEADTQYTDQVELQEMLHLAMNVTNHYWNTYKEPDSELTTIATELEFMVMLDENICYTGTIDWVFQDKEGRIWFADHKTTASLDSYEKNAIMDRQISRYYWALQQIAAGVGRIKGKIIEDGVEKEIWVESTNLEGKEIYGFIYNLILKDVPKKPELLKKGGLSKAKSQKTTYDLYALALSDIYGVEIPDEYGEILLHLKNLPNQYFRRIEVTRLQEEIDAAIWEFYYTAEDMAGLRSGLDLEKKLGTPPGMTTKPSDKLYRNITRDCHWDCPFKALCEAEISGMNTSLLLNTIYEKEDK
jgi:hypothetical protein